MHTRFLRLTLAACACAIALAAVPLQAQVVEQRIQIASDGGAGAIQMPMGMGGRQNKTGTGRIRGRVVASDGSGPVRRAQVRLTSQDITPKVALTDAEGRFEFRELPASRFTMQASKSGFVTIQYGQTRPFESGKPIELAERQLLDNADIAVPRGGVISGRIVDEFGDALPDVQVTAMRQTWSNGRRRLTPSPGRVASTNDLGQFRIYGLPPGEYYVSASMRGSAIEMMDMELMVAATGATAATAAAPTASAPKSGYASTYYPGTANVAEAQRVTLASGQEATGADFPLVPVRLARVTGVVINSEGKPVEGAMVSVVPASRDVGFALGLSTARSARNGTFALSNVPPGDYVLQTRAMQVFSSTQGDNVMMFRAAAMAGESESGSAPLSVAGEDIENLMLTTSKGGTAVGRVSFDGPKPANAPVRVMATPTDPENPILAGGAAATVNEDGTFELKGLAGTRLIRAALPPGWTVKSVKLNGLDITDAGADFKTGETTSGLEIELTSKPTAVSGGVSESGAPLKDYTVVVFSETPDHWRLPMTRWVAGARPDQDGRFKIQNLPAGSYYAVAVDYLPQGEWGDPEILDRLRTKATRFTLDDGATQTLDLRLTGQY